MALGEDRHAVDVGVFQGLGEFLGVEFGAHVGNKGIPAASGGVFQGECNFGCQGTA